MMPCIKEGQSICKKNNLEEKMNQQHTFMLGKNQQERKKLMLSPRLKEYDKRHAN